MFKFTFKFKFSLFTLIQKKYTGTIIIGTKKKREIRASIHVTLNITLEKGVVAKGASFRVGHYHGAVTNGRRFHLQN